MIADKFAFMKFIIKYEFSMCLNPFCMNLNRVNKKATKWLYIFLNGDSGVIESWTHGFSVVSCTKYSLKTALETKKTSFVIRLVISKEINVNHSFLYTHKVLF